MRLFRMSILVLLLFFNCSKDVDIHTDKTYTIETIEGVNYVHNHAPLWGDTLKVGLEFVQQIGGMDVTDENYIMYKIGDIMRDAEGDIYVLDTGNFRIQRFNSQGEYKGTIGRKGQGPGEFTSVGGRPGLQHFNFDNEDRFYIGNVNDFIVMEKNGKEIRRFKIEKTSIVPRCRFLSDDRIVMGGGMILYSVPIQSMQETTFPLFKVFDLNGKILFSFGKPYRSQDEYTVYIYEDAPFDVDGHGNMYIAYRYHNRIEKRDSEGNLVLVFDRPLNYEVTKFHSKDGMHIIPNTISMGTAVDSKERLWVITFTKQPEGWEDLWWEEERFRINRSCAVFELYSKDGILLGLVPVPQDMCVMMRICDDRLYMIDTDRVSILEYKIIEN